LFCPIPWIIYASALDKRRELTPDAVFLFTGTLLLAAAFIISVTVFTFVLALLPV